MNVSVGVHLTGKDRTYLRSLYKVVNIDLRIQDIYVVSVIFNGRFTEDTKPFTWSFDELNKDYRIATNDEVAQYIASASKQEGSVTLPGILFPEGKEPQLEETEQPSPEAPTEEIPIANAKAFNILRTIQTLSYNLCAEMQGGGLNSHQLRVETYQLDQQLAALRTELLYMK